MDQLDYALQGDNRPLRDRDRPTQTPLAFGADMPVWTIKASDDRWVASRLFHESLLVLTQPGSPSLPSLPHSLRRVFCPHGVILTSREGLSFQAYYARYYRRGGYPRRPRR